MNDFIANLPKAELHVHLEGTLEPELSFELAKKHGIELEYATAEDLLRAYNFHDLPSFLRIYYKGMSVLLDEDRIDHGVNSLEDPALCATIAERGLGLTICPVSNRFVVQNLTAVEIRRMLSLGMRATVNSDDPAYFRAYVNENLQALQDDGGMTRDEIVQLVSNSFTVAWLDETRRASYLERVRSYVDRH